MVKNNIKILPSLLFSMNVPVQCYVLFEREWPNGVEVTIDNVIRAIVLGFDIDYFAYHFFNNIAIHHEYIGASEAALKKYGLYTSEYRQAKAEAFVKAFNETTGID